MEADYEGGYENLDVTDLIIEPAQLSDVEAITSLIDASVRTLQAGDYSQEQIDGALGSVFGVDRQLIRDQSYFVVRKGSEIIACGGWSRRRTLFGADAVANRDDEALTPGLEAAKIRAFFVDPKHARQGVGAKLLAACEDAAAAYGFTEAELGATLTGIPLYARYGYVEIERYETPLPNGHAMEIVRMGKTLAGAMRRQ